MFIIPAPKPIAFNIFGIPVYKYGVIMALAIFVAILVANKLFNSDKKVLKKDIIIEYAPIIIILGILCARMYFCLLNSGYYFSHPLEIIDIRQGGLSIHGGIAGGLLSMVIIAFKEKISFLSLMDSTACATFLGQAIGRWGNYFNSEAFGLPVANQSWGLFVPQNLRPVQYSDFSLFHPAFLYESCLDLISFCLLLYIFKNFSHNCKGIVFFIYLILYSIIRFSIEQIRIDSALNIGSVPIAEIISVILFVIGIIGSCIVIKNNVKSL